MGNFSRDTFDELKHYVGVRLQQGVPLLDADWNEQEDIKHYEMRTFLKWFVGDGVPYGNDGFRIEALAVPAEDFLIKGGADGQTGICIVDGWYVMNENDVQYTLQPLYTEPALASEWGVDPLSPLTTPTETDREDLVYLDTWEREVDSGEDDDLINPAIGIETCVRLKREWVVRVAEGTTELPEPPQGHAYYLLATLTRHITPEVEDADLWDERHTGLSLQHTGGTVSSSSGIENVITTNKNQLNVSASSTATGNRSQVNASNRSTADGVRCQINVSSDSMATGEPSQVNASNNSEAINNSSQVNASGSSTASGNKSQVNASHASEATNAFSQVNASSSSTASGDKSQVNASFSSEAINNCSQVNAGRYVRTAADFTVCGGYGSTEASSANRKWELNSEFGHFTYTGTLYTSFSDYGEYFENTSKGEIDMGLLIALSGTKVRPAKKDETFIGVKSGTAAIRLGDSPFCWQGRYLKDEWGQPIYEEIKDPAWQPQEGESETDRPYIRVQKENPAFDAKKEQVPRSQRPDEWTMVGLLGQVYVRCDKTVKPGDYVKSKGKGIGTKSQEPTILRAMKISKEFDGDYAIVYCLLK